MLMSAVVDPSSFDKDYFEDPSYEQNAQIFLRGVLANGLLIVDSDGILKDLLINNIKSLSLKYGERFVIIIAELLKNKRHKIVNLDSFGYKKNVDTILQAYEIRKNCKADSFIVSIKSFHFFESNNFADPAITPLSNYIYSDFEKKRRWFFEELPSIDNLKKTEIEDIIIRIIKYSKWLRFYDKQIGSGDRTSFFRKGIEYILSLWEKNGILIKDCIGEVEIISCVKSSDRIKKIKSDLLVPLKSKFSFHFTLRLKEDKSDIFHARFLETQHAIVLFERGFDLFKNDGNSFRRNFLKLENTAFNHLNECRNLKDIAVEK